MAVILTDEEGPFPQVQSHTGIQATGAQGQTLHRKNPLCVDGAGSTGNKHEGTQDVTSHR